MSTNLPSTTVLYFDKGSIVVRGPFGVPSAVWDERIRAFRTQAYHFGEIINYLDQSRLQFQDKVQDLVPCPHLNCEALVLRGYQKNALKSWERAGRRGVIVLPTGAGKTVVALKAIELVNEPALVVVPTLDLLEQWRNRISKEFSIETGVLGASFNSLTFISGLFFHTRPAILGKEAVDRTHFIGRIGIMRSVDNIPNWWTALNHNSPPPLPGFPE